jgi:hypothetical protein
MKAIWHLLWTALFAVLVTANAHAAKVEDRGAVDQKINRYRVNDARGIGDCKAKEKECPLQQAVDQARADALVYAAGQLSSDPGQKAKAEGWVKDHLTEALAHATAGELLSRMETSEKFVVEVDTIVDVNVEGLRLMLEGNKVITSDKALAKAVGNPTILVIYSELEKNPNDRELTQLGEVVTTQLESFFASRRWELVDQDAVRKAREQQIAMQEVAGMPEDPLATLAALAGADMYVEFSFAKDMSSGYQASTSITAYETVTGQKTGAAVGRSSTLMSADWALAAQQSIGAAMPDLFEQIRGYWQLAAEEGRRIKVIVRSPRGLFADYDRQKDVRDALKDVADTWRQGTATASTIEGLLLTTEKDPSDVADDLYDALKDAGFSKVSYKVQSRALLLLEVE